MKMDFPPETLDDLDESELYLSTLLVGKTGDCPECPFEGNPERLQFLHHGIDAVYCSDCGSQIPPEKIRTMNRGGRVNIR